MAEIDRNITIEPFAHRFMEVIPEEEILDASGNYDEKSQTWIMDSGSDSSALMTGMNPERPPTTCSRMTKVGIRDFRTDTYVDD